MNPPWNPMSTAPMDGTEILVYGVVNTGFTPIEGTTQDPEVIVLSWQYSSFVRQHRWFSSPNSYNSWCDRPLGWLPVPEFVAPVDEARKGRWVYLPDSPPSDGTEGCLTSAAHMISAERADDHPH